MSGVKGIGREKPHGNHKEVQTKTLNQAVKRNLKRFPDDFMFQLTEEEAQEFLRSQFVTLKRGQHFKYLPFVFTENGVAMLSGILNSDRAFHGNIQICGLLEEEEVRYARSFNRKG